MINEADIKEAVLLTGEGHFEEAESLYKKLLAEAPDNTAVLSAFGLFYVSRRDYEHACQYLKKSCEIKETLGNLSALGFAEYECGNLAEAAETLEKALNYGENLDIYNKLSECLFKTYNYSKVAKYVKLMYEKYPDNQTAVANMVKYLTHTGELAKAEKLCVEYLKNHNEASVLWLHLGFLKELIYSNDKQACECFRIAAELGHPDGFYNMAVSYGKQNDLKKAQLYYEKALKIFPEDRTIITSYGMCLLKQKNFNEGYKYYFNRSKTKLDKLTQNKWTPGCNFESEAVVICDQGYGDNIQFSRYFPILKTKVDKLFVAVRQELRGLFEHNFDNITFIDYEEMNPEMQSIRSNDLPYALGLDFDHIPSPSGYLNIREAELKSDSLKVGICWEAGGAGMRNAINRTVLPIFLEPLFKEKGIQYYSFQKTDTLNGKSLYPQMIDLAENCKTFEDTAMYLKSIDVLITVDTAIAHLAGALGIKTLLLLPYSSDWRWFNDTKTTPWYDSIEIFQQINTIDWVKPIEDIRCRLKKYSS